ncbi:ATPase with chaperone activity, ATP-binding subunit [Candidatus Moduliflexus flocculans]|uniref:ATPase with chaperone activity, ATP-binding subunit n=1 Tax=Candidatus Moduliflexus flocculans TaxID=1499966 RepID=A0A0S6VTJ3_9BACT|nr:ATPase with chaperone activity, ATP-binding subunit [Candidatus Moduliflexus flocculans]
MTDSIIYSVFSLFLGIAFGFGLHRLWQRRESSPADQSLQELESSEKKEAESPPDTKGAALYALANDMRDFYQSTAHPKDMLQSQDFLRGVEMLTQPVYSDEELLDYYAGENPLIACMALEALNRRSETVQWTDQLLSHLDECYLWPMHFAFRLLERAEKPVIGAVLAKAQDWWEDERLFVKIMNTFMKERIERGETPSLKDQLEQIDDEKASILDNLLKKLDTEIVKPLIEELKQKSHTQLDAAYLNTVGTLWEPKAYDDLLWEHPHFLELLEHLQRSLFEKPARSVIVVGESGVGKTALIRALEQRLQARGWRIFEASATDVLAGQIYIGELEERLQKLVKQLEQSRSVVWFAPNFHELFYAGRYKYNPVGILEKILPFIESGTLRMIGETYPVAYDALLRDTRRIETAFEKVTMLPLHDKETLELAYQWAAHQEKLHGESIRIEHDTITEAWHLARQFLGDKATPGNLLNFLKSTQKTLFLDGKPRQITTDSLYATLSHLTGLPRSILDDREGLDLSGLERLFQHRVMGQPEAIECLVERVAMIKAGLTDPTRPYGVFLFAGPTGTGKTEMAKTLAEFMFGSPERMIRLDMSEFKTYEAEKRIVGGTERDDNTSSLISLIRKQPFSVILLDEFEKAHPNIWDLFLQVFDDGRLTDRYGNTADFRHSIIILTSNLGATLPTGAGIGFNPIASNFSMKAVEQAITETFLPEFINRLDRVVVFRPLSRSIMRTILYKELNNTLHRRGLRNREWAVEWENSAIEFLLEKGFTAALGARPLKRAIERYLLSPLAMTIVKHQLPEGDQFLFVRGDSTQIQVEFIDPDAHLAENAPPQGNATETSAILTAPPIKSLVFDAQGHREEVERLEQAYETLMTSVESDAWRQKKQSGLQQMSSKEFWMRPERYDVLSSVEFMDRIEAGLQTAGSLLHRLIGTETHLRTVFPKDLICRVAEQIYLLQEAYRTHDEGLSRDAFLLLEIAPTSDASVETLREFAAQLQAMYLNWAQKRRMHVQVLQEFTHHELEQTQCLIAVSGFGAYAILASETGLHVWEMPGESKAFVRHHVRVRVTPQPVMPLRENEPQLAQAKRAFANTEQSVSVVVRRYRNVPSPLVRDSVHHWRTGRLDRVFSGDFDVMT